MADSNNLKNIEKTLPSYFYYDRSFFNDELEKIWNRNWIYVCHVSNLKDKLSFKTLKIGFQSLIILRDRNDNINAFINTCRHRGSILCDSSSGKLASNLLVCPYHQWSYNVADGSLKKTSSFNEPEGFDKSAFSLFRLKVHIWRGCIFINLKNDAEWNLQNVFPRPTDNLINFPLENMISAHTWVKEIKCNWKIFWENFNECLHCPNIHPELSELVPVFKRRIMNIKDHPNWVQDYNEEDPKFSGGLRKNAQTWSNDGSAQGNIISNLNEDDIQKGHSYSSSWPSVFIGAYADHIRIVRVLPKGPETVELVSEWLFQKETLDDKNYNVDNVINFACKVMEQDAEVCELNQKGIYASQYKEGVLMPEEYLVKKFHDWIREKLK